MVTITTPSPVGSVPSPQYVTMVSQTQNYDEIYPPSDDDHGSHHLINVEDMGIDDIATKVNTQLDDNGDIIAAKLEVIVDQIFTRCIQELQIEYTNGNTS